MVETLAAWWASQTYQAFGEGLCSDSIATSYRQDKGAVMLTSASFVDRGILRERAWGGKIVSSVSISSTFEVLYMMGRRSHVHTQRCSLWSSWYATQGRLWFSVCCPLSQRSYEGHVFGLPDGTIVTLKVSIKFHHAEETKLFKRCFHVMFSLRGL